MLHVRFFRGQHWAPCCSPCTPITDLPNSVTSGSAFVYANDTTVRCIGDTVDRALSELNRWDNSPLGKVWSNVIDDKTVHLAAKFCDCWRSDWSSGSKYTRLLGVTIDNRLSWSHHLTDVKKNFENKLNNLKTRSFFYSSNKETDTYNIYNRSSAGMPYWICILRLQYTFSFI